MKRLYKNLESYPEIKEGGHNVNNLRYANDTVLIAENKKKTCNNHYTLWKKKAERKDEN